MKSLELISLFEKMYKEHWSYEWGAAREGCVDCSGAFVYAFKKFGQTIAHGSNSIARQYISGEIRKASEAKPGWIVFKWREANSDTPDKYKADGLGDFYHVGLCTLDCNSVLNAKGTNSGFCQDPLSKWAYAAPLKGVDYSDQEGDEHMAVLYKAVVTTARDDLRVRSKPSIGDIIEHVPRGKTVDVLDDSNSEWFYISYNGITGYASSTYLTRVYEVTHEDQDYPTSSGTVTIPIAQAKALYELLGQLLSVD